MKSRSIGEVAKRSGVRASALRYYEEAGILPATARVGGRRRYVSRTARVYWRARDADGAAKRRSGR